MEFLDFKTNTRQTSVVLPDSIYKWLRGLSDKSCRPYTRELVYRLNKEKERMEKDNAIGSTP